MDFPAQLIIEKPGCNIDLLELALDDFATTTPSQEEWRQLSFTWDDDE